MDKSRNVQINTSVTAGEIKSEQSSLVKSNSIYFYINTIFLDFFLGQLHLH